MGKCGNIALDIKTYFAGRNQPTHPNVIAFDTPWHGYRYYMGYTPYPYGNGFEENPCLAGSNDLIHWENPEGLRNPIATSEELACDELKDSHLLYRGDLDRLEMWYLGRIESTMAEGGQLHCLRKVSKDGRSWSNYEVMYSFGAFNLVSESVIYNGEYLFWGIRHTKEDTGLYFMRSSDGICWTEPEKCEIPGADTTDMWHGTVIYQEGRYHFVWVGNSGAARGRVYYAHSMDGLRFSDPQVIIENDAGWKFLYRPCLLKTRGQWYCYYGVIRCDNRWMISMSRGESLHNLSGITGAELGAICQPLDNLVDSDFKLLVRQWKHRIGALFTPRLMLLIPFSLLLGLLNYSTLFIWLTAMIIAAVGSFALNSPQQAVLRGLFMGTINACISTFFSDILRTIIL